MSYCRYKEGESDIGVYQDSLSKFLVCMCPDRFITYERSEMLDHLAKHKHKGDLVPNNVINRLEEEIKELGSFTLEDNYIDEDKLYDECLIELQKIDNSLSRLELIYHWCLVNKISFKVFTRLTGDFWKGLKGIG